jgi:hypothetical protein
MSTPARRLSQYADLYTWSHPLRGPGVEGLIAHQDGAVSCAIHWDGIDAEMLSESERAARWGELYTLLSSIGTDTIAEFHWWREEDDSVAHAYLDKSRKIVRGGALAHAVREAMAEHLAPYGMTNRCALVLTRRRSAKFSLFAGKSLIHQAEEALALAKKARELCAKLPGARLATFEEYCRLIIECYDRRAFKRDARFKFDPQFLLAEQLLREAPMVDAHRNLRIGDELSRILLVHLYPDALPAWFLGMATQSLSMRVVQVVHPVDTRQSLKASERASDFAEGAMGRRGRDTAAATVRDMSEFRQFVTQNNLAIFKNVFIVQLYGTAQELDDQSRIFSDWIETNGGQVRDADYLQLPYLRASMPGQGYMAPRWRTDHSWQVGNMLPIQSFARGDANPESLRLGQSGQLIGLGLTTQSIPHSFTVAMTGAGKGVEKVATIAETFPLGIDWLIAEIGGSYKWVVEGFGGVYSKIDPTETVVNPLPPYSAADPAADVPLDAKIAGGTVNALAFLLTDGKTELSFHAQAAAQAALQVLYGVPRTDKQAPSLPDFLTELESAARGLDSVPQRASAKDMAANLASFLETTEGRIFARDDNLVLSDGITGVDLKEVDRASPKLLKFYLVFIALRFNHLAFARRNPARVLLDEMHKFVAIAPEVMGKLISELARMGRKDAAAIDLVTQGIKEIDVIEKEVLNSMPIRTLLYRPDGWDEIADRIGMPAAPLSVWKDFPYPEKLTWRPGIRSIGPHYYNLHLTFPQLLLDLADTSSAGLDIKEDIGTLTRDPMDRLKLFREYMEARG